MIEPAEVARWQRNLDAMLRVAGSDDPESFAAVVKLLDDARARLPAAAVNLRTVEGFSHRDLARALGVSRSAVAQRFASGCGKS